MKIANVIHNKGAEVVTIRAQATVAELVELLARRNIGAVVVSSDGRSVDGIVSERDVVRHLAADGGEILNRTVAEVMTTPVVTATLEDGLGATAHTMTYSRLRHIPVVEDGQLVAIVSLGDVVKYRIDQLTDERNHLLEYLHT
ncbi:CBS domain-containing protein [Propionicimonas sp.]|jgi:CBS domain-containing protein|uniref:CBS domain-containing protein n=1 Tax=Propionicimonas sp. TaxID=1955623 RepID=UPI0017AB2EF0|nr:CBS domain-containing protein [Propionicimonas sp.]MBU3976634.1 CBS domain-containing protein [Actinomycetota bacterium]MBA3020366.1 CBS domain-containing protein [Propionicimonas sp.]MBU3986539.1 CBS domain-containing protein [Actinomycetota bacterium]MBU4007309.1 CBS domain-containing protein [Actinomycetota bacterium]MBU4065062.1 CBS domain-containing protein [Actinomycetota bacterium]